MESERKIEVETVPTCACSADEMEEAYARANSPEKFEVGDLVYISDETGFLDAGLYLFEGYAESVLILRKPGMSLVVLPVFSNYCMKIVKPYGQITLLGLPRTSDNSIDEA